MRAELKAMVLCALGALIWFAPFLAPGKALLGTHVALFRPFADAPGIDAATLAEVKAAARPLYTDKLLQHDPEVLFSFVPRRAAPLPAWNPQVLGGLPHLATGLSSSLHPLQWLAHWIAPPRCYAVIAAVQAAIAGWFAFLMLRAFRVAPAAAGCGALLFAGSGWMSYHQEYFQLTAAATWFPLALYGAQRLLERAGGLLPLGLAIGGAFLSGFPQIAFYAPLAAGLLVAATLALRLSNGTLAIRAAAPLAARAAVAALLGLGLAAPQLLATAELVPWSTRRPLDAAILEQAALPPGALLGTLFPDLLGRAPTAAESEAESSRAAAEHRPPRLDTLFGVALADTARADGRNNPFELACALGVVPLVLAGFALVASRRRARFFFAALAAAGLALALPGPLLRASAHVPGLDIGDPKRALFLLQAALGALAAFGLDAAFSERAPARRAALWLAAVGAVLLGSAALAATFATPDRLGDWAAPRIAASLGLGVADVRGALPATWLADGRTLLLTELAQAAIACLLASAALAWRARRHDRPLAATLALFAVLAAPLALLWHHATAPIPTAGLGARPPLLEALLQQPPLGRILRVGSATATPVLPPKLPMRYGLRDAQGYVAVFLQPWADLFEAIEPGATLSVAVRPLTDPRHLERPLFDLLDVELAFVETPAATPLPPLAGWREEPLPAGSDGGGTLHRLRNTEVLGRATIVPEVRVVADEAAIVQRITAPDFEPARVAYITEAQRADLAAAGFAARPDPAAVARTVLLESESDRLRFATAGAGGLLVQSDNWYPGWTARVDGRPVPLLRVDHALRGVVVPAGDHEVEFAYVPRPLLLGLFLAPLAFALLCFAAFTVGRAPPAAIVAAWPTPTD